MGAHSLRDAPPLRRIRVDVVIFDPSRTDFTALENAGFDVEVDQDDIDDDSPAQDAVITVVTRQPLHEVVETIRQLVGKAASLSGWIEDLAQTGQVPGPHGTGKPGPNGPGTWPARATRYLFSSFLSFFLFSLFSVVNKYMGRKRGA